VLDEEITMRRRLSLAMLITIPCIVAIGVTAQTADVSNSSPDRTTVVGCLTSTGFRPSPGSGGPTYVTTFVITITGARTSGVVPTSGTIGTGNANSSAYRLDVDYNRLYSALGHKIEVVGTVQEQKNGITTDAGSVLDWPKLKVDSFKVLSSTCS
jgi:hypothetical protein